MNLPFKKIFLGLGLLLISVFLSKEIFSIRNQREELNSKFSELDNQYQDIKSRNKKLADFSDSLNDPVLRERAVRSISNYKKPDESLYVVIPRVEKNENK